MLEPGASRSTYGDWLEKAETVSLSVVEPTATTLEMQGGGAEPVSTRRLLAVTAADGGECLAAAADR